MTSSPRSTPAPPTTVTAFARRDRSGGRRPAPGRPAQRAPELASLTLDELRAYRQELITEESRVSYWRRILHARLDLASGDTRFDGMRTVLSQHHSDSRRLAQLPVDAPSDGAPPLPDLTVLWATERDDPHGPDSDMVSRLAAAEHQLSAYRRGLHRRLDTATGELIARYRDEPVLALGALPGQRRRAGLHPIR